MALRNPKISREVLQTCNRLISSNPERTFANGAKPVDLAAEAKEDPSHFRYVVANNRKTVLPEIQFEKDPDFISPETRHLQPALLPNYIEFKERCQVTPPMKVGIQNPFPEPIKELRRKNSTFPSHTSTTTKTSTLKVNFKNLAVTGNSSTRMFTTRSAGQSSITISRSYASNSRKGNKNDDCEPQKNINKCKQESRCPRFVMKDCTPSKGSDCKHHYIDPKCSKRMAPYPSYSELCAERLPDDPSECMQCPWQKCGGTEGIKPPKRYYHTGTVGTQMATNAGGATGAIVTFIPPFFDVTRCDARKEPCKPPPPKCKKEKEEKDKCPEPEKTNKSKKCNSLNWIEADRLGLEGPQVTTEGLLVGIGETATSEGDQLFDRLAGGCEKMKVHFAKEHDKGHPPPCPTKRQPSKECPQDEGKKRKYRQQRDLNTPYYPRNRQPWHEEDKC